MWRAEARRELPATPEASNASPNREWSWPALHGPLSFLIGTSSLAQTMKSCPSQLPPARLLHIHHLHIQGLQIATMGTLLKAMTHRLWETYPADVHTTIVRSGSAAIACPPLTEPFPEVPPATPPCYPYPVHIIKPQSSVLLLSSSAWLSLYIGTR